MDLVVAVTLLHGTIRANNGLAHTGAETSGEWPPSVARLQSALVAGGGIDGTEESLVALEGWDPPRIFADHPADVLATRQTNRYPVTNYIQNLQPDRTGDPPKRPVHSQGFPVRIAQLVFPGTVMVPKHPRVVYQWDNITLSDAQLKDLQERASRVGYFGCADSPALVQVHDANDTGILNIKDGLGEWIPDVNGSARIEVPFAGRGEVLARHFENIKKAGLGHRSWIRKEVSGYRPPGEPEAKPAPIFIVKEFCSGGVRPIGRTAIRIAEEVRSAILSGYGTAPGVVHGHKDPDGTSDGEKLDGDHMRVFVLPNVGHRHANGSLFGVGVMLPADTDADVVRKIRKAVWDLKTVSISDLCIELTLRNGSNKYKTTDPEKWTTPARTWVTAIPATTSRWPKKREGITDEDVRLMCEQAGLPKPEKVTTSWSGLTEGALVLHPSDAQRTSKDGHPKRKAFLSHFRVTFTEPVRGPVLIGPGRYFGLGLMLPEPEKDSSDD